MSNQSQKNGIQTRVFVWLSILLAVILAACIWFFVSQLSNKTSAEVKIVENITGKAVGYDFNNLKNTYPDIIAWLEIPNTGVNFPVVQHPEDDSYYLNHNNKSEQDIGGAAYVELCNSPRFDDPVTVIYGHNMKDGTIFNTLHYFEDANFFEENNHFYLYTQGHKYTYTIFAAEATDNSHIINTHNFADESVFTAYQQKILNDLSVVKHVRSDVTLNKDSKIVQLSTCMNEVKFSNQRYIVSGVLTDDQQTI